MSDAPRSSRAQALVDYISRGANPFARLVAVTAANDRDLVDIIVEPELVQHRVVPIALEEIVRLSFSVSDADAPRITSLRDDFPLGLVHTNFDPDVDGLCLCMWEEGWADLRRTLTAQALVERIRDWFSRTARGDLHQTGQGLEPLLAATAHTLIIPPGPLAEVLHVVRAEEYKERWTVTLSPQPAAKTLMRFAVCTLVLEPVIQGALRERPRDLQGLATLLDGFGGKLEDHLCRCVLRDENRLRGADRQLLLLIWIPKKRNEDGPVESQELWAFATATTIADIGGKLGQTFHMAGEVSLTKRIPPGPVESLNEIKLDGWRVVQRLDRATARAYAGNPVEKDANLVAVGAGAIGSHIITNTLRAGVGLWTVIDDDITLPHNTVRQTQPDRAVGDPKADAIAVICGDLLAEDSIVAIRANLLDAADRKEVIADAIAAADIVLDFSASPAVLGELSDWPAIKRVGSLFFNPDGCDVVALIEDQDRMVRIDELEAQYFLSATRDPLGKHLGGARIDRLRYANACQDLTSPLPPWQVQTLSAIAGGRLLKAVAEPEEVAQLWQLDTQTGGVVPTSLPISSVHRFVLEGFRVTVTNAVLDCMAGLRRTAAPDETGGVLVGSFDAERRVLHILEALPAPPDSRQSPTYFIRGARHLKPQLDQIAARSGATLAYVGEWHSHPDGAAARPSADDEKVFTFLTEQLEPTGSPYVMAIRGASQFWLRAGWRDSTAQEVIIDHVG